MMERSDSSESKNQQDETLRNRLRAENSYPLSEWVVASRDWEDPRFVAGEDPETCWVIDFSQVSGGDWIVKVYPPDEDPDEDLSRRDRVGSAFETQAEARSAVDDYLGVDDE